MKPADSEKNNGKQASQLHLSFFLSVFAVLYATWFQLFFKKSVTQFVLNKYSA